MKKIYGLISLLSIIFIVLLLFKYNENHQLQEEYKKVLAEKKEDETLHNTKIKDLNTKLLELNAKIEGLNKKLSKQGMTLRKFKNLTNTQLYHKLEKDKNLFNQNIENIQTKFRELISKLGIIHESFQPLTENSFLITKGASAISFFVPGVNTLNGAIEFIADVDTKISSYINATEKGRLYLINKQISLLIENKNLHNIAKIIKEVDLYKQEVAKLSEDLEKVKSIVSSLEKNAGSLFDLIKEYQIHEVIDNISSFFTNDTNENKQNTNDEKSEIVKNFEELKNKISQDVILVKDNLVFTNNLYSNLIVIQRFASLQLREEPNNSNNIPSVIQKVTIAETGIVPKAQEKVVAKNREATKQEVSTDVQAPTSVHKETKIKNTIDTSHTITAQKIEEYKSVVPKLEITKPVSNPVKKQIEKKYSVTFDVIPSDAKIDITNIKDIFYQGIQLKKGRYYVEVTKEGYQTYKNSFMLTNNHSANIVLEKEISQYSKIKLANQPVVPDVPNNELDKSENIGTTNLNSTISSNIDLVTEIIESEYGDITIQYPRSIFKNQSFIINVMMTNFKKDAKGGLSISFPQYETSNLIQNKKYNGFESFDFYNKGKEIYSVEFHKNINANYLLMEGWSKRWNQFDQKSVSVTILPDKDIKYLFINIRGVLIESGEEYILPINGVVGQQGYFNKRIEIIIK